MTMSYDYESEYRRFDFCWARQVLFLLKHLQICSDVLPRGFQFESLIYAKHWSQQTDPRQFGRNRAEEKSAYLTPSCDRSASFPIA